MRRWVPVVAVIVTSWSCGAPPADPSDERAPRDAPDAIEVDAGAAEGAQSCERLLGPGTGFDEWPAACVADDGRTTYPVIVIECRDGRELKINDYAYQYEDEELVIDPDSAELFRSCLPE